MATEPAAAYFFANKEAWEYPYPQKPTRNWVNDQYQDWGALIVCEVIITRQAVNDDLGRLLLGNAR